MHGPSGSSCRADPRVRPALPSLAGGLTYAIRGIVAAWPGCVKPFSLGELGRNEGLRRLIGIEEERHLPKSWNVSRFLEVLGQEPHLSELRCIFDTMIQNRHLWKDQTEQMLPGHDGNSNIVYDEAGTVHCYDRTSTPIVRHKMAYIGYEPERETIKYRCPARHEDWSCPHDAVCNAGKLRLGPIQKALAQPPAT
jgi:hypothetical protein